MTLFIILYSKNNNNVAVFCSLLFLVSKNYFLAVQHHTQHQNHTMSHTIECSYIHMFTALDTGHVLLGGCDF